VLPLLLAAPVNADMVLFTRFLLKYVSRDEVELLNRGSSGVVEIRGVISQYTEESPLYGFIRYRRRSILIKYVPEGTSRLIQGKTLALLSSVYSSDHIWSSLSCLLLDN
jgi:hypothetical protein